ncbi:hypothetical protein Q6346_03345 [Isoptericola sp. b490]|uniref:hypothetical protein n=1 Tax=Actinotalea lenta TaxID=3064654 RepID=UPI0027123945|nr:hypothetical protein [Isoptericola sp. b490]MDO8120346.1 hypothetical protein [Isoptericola sp. b490]
MQTVVPEDLDAALRSAGLRVAGPLDAREDRARWTALGPDGRRWAILEAAAGEADGARRRAHALAAVDHPNVAAAGPVLDRPGGGVLLLVAAEPGVDLAVLMAARGPLDDAEATGVLVPVAGALAALHAAGLAHGALTPADVVLTAAGPVLVDVGGGTGPVAVQQAADVAALVQLGRRLVGPGPGPVADALGGADPTARTLEAALRTASEPRPVDLPDSAVLARLALQRFAGQQPGEPVRPSRRTANGGRGTRRGRLRRGGHGRRGRTGGPRARLPWHRVVVASVAIVAVAVAWAVIVRGGRDDARARAVQLTEQRITALAAGDIAGLAALTEPGSPAALADARLRPEPVEVEWLAVEAGRRVEDGCPAGLVCVPVTTRTRIAGDSIRTARVTLALRPGTWRVVQVSPAR